MRTIIAGSRDCIDMGALLEAIGECGWLPTLVVCGGARGADELGKRWANEHGVPVELYLPDWNVHGRAAGPIRNAEMAANAEALIALWDGRSRGTRHMIDTARRKGLRVYVHMCG